MYRLLDFLTRYAPWCCGFYLLGLAIVSLWPRTQLPVAPVQKEKSSGLLPKEGDNFKIVDSFVVYRLEQGRRRPYKHADAFLTRPENPPFGTAYADGGILLCDSAALLLYPLGVKMPRPDSATLLPFNKRTKYKLQEGTSLLQKDKIGHLLVYFIFAVLLWLSLARSPILSEQALLWRVVLLGSIVGFLLELGQQYFSVGRDAEWADMLMNVAGLLLGAWLCYSWQRSPKARS